MKNTKKTSWQVKIDKDRKDKGKNISNKLISKSISIEILKYQ